MASQIQQSSDLWDLEHYLTERRKEILREEELRGLQEDKLNSIRSVAQFLAKYAA